MSRSPVARAFLQKRGITDETAERFGLGYVRRGEKYRGMLAIPYMDAQGRERTTRFRTLPPRQKLYLTRKGGGTHLFNVAAVENPVVAICEGELDAVILEQMGTPAVAIPGATAWDRAWRWLFRNTDLVLVVTDADEEGLKARNRIVGHLNDITQAEPVELPEGLDVTDLYLSDERRLRELLS